MRNGDSPQGIYAPLSQIMTDSESEEEIHNSSRPQEQRFQQNYIAGFEHQLSKTRQTYNSGRVQNHFKSVMISGVHSGSFTSFNSDGEAHHTEADNVAILGSDDGKDEPMTPMRKCCFIASIAACFLTVILFLWAVPCEDGRTCPAPLDRIKTHNWLHNYTRVELKGVVNVVDGLRSWEKNLIFLYRGDAYFPEFEQNNKKKNGIIALIGSSGAISWFVEMVNEPIVIDCYLLDVDLNGKPDCLVIDEFGDLGTINPISGQWIWKFVEENMFKIDVLDFPAILPDLDADGVFEVLLATNGKSTGKKKRNAFTIISGKTGIPFEDGYELFECDALRKFQLSRSAVLTFTCIKNSSETHQSKSIAEIYSLITNKSVGQKIPLNVKIAQHKQFGQRKETEAQRNIYSLNGKELVVENRGKCPENCNLTFTLTEQKNGKVKTLHNFTAGRMYGMVPAQWHFKNSKSKLSGFVMKFWQWGNLSHANKGRTKRTTPLPTSDFNIFDNLIQNRNTYTIPGYPSPARVERSIANITKLKSSSSSVLDNYKMQIIKETVVLIIFNGTYTNIENTSESSITQFCRNERSNTVCQPDLNNQENSLLIADLDQDGSQELVSYYSTYINNEDDKKEKKLVTYVQLLRLEAELPTLYENPKHK